MAEYAKVTDNCPLQIDAMVQLHDWQNLKAVRTTAPGTVACGGWVGVVLGAAAQLAEPHGSKCECVEGSASAFILTLCVYP